jgi:hypothetical protein
MAASSKKSISFSQGELATVRQSVTRNVCSSKLKFRSFRSVLSLLVFNNVGAVIKRGYAYASHDFLSEQ